jgi:signal transduction histidine kinase
VTAGPVTFRRGRHEGFGVLDSPALVTFAAGLSLATLALVWLGFVATREWRRGADLLLERRQAEALALVMAALTRDMTGASTTLIVPATEAAINEEPPFELQQLAARTFARFPYPESFVTWTKRDTDEAFYAFNRTERRPRWDRKMGSDEPFPVTTARNPSALTPVIRALRQRATVSDPFLVIEMDIEGIPYQVVAHLFFQPTPPYGLSAVAAFTVDLNWVRQAYFEPLLRQVAQIGGNEDVLSFMVLDPSGSLVARTVPALGAGGEFERRFPLMFLDRALVPSNGTRPVREWTVQVRPSFDNALLAAQRGTRRMFILLAVAAAASIVALLLTIRAIQARAALAAMQSDFVSAVTHELKTPLSLIRLVGDTLAGGRYTSPKTVQEYAGLLSQEARRLGHSIDNLLTYARYTEPETSAAIEFKPTRLGDLVEDALDEFRHVLEQKEFAVSVDIPGTLPPVAGDRTSLLHVVENIIDNAIKYSGNGRSLTITGSANGKHVMMSFADRGIGIPEGDIARVLNRFFRARNASGSGSGLGLAIAQRIVSRHGGKIQIQSAVDIGTQVTLVLPIADRS